MKKHIPKPGTTPRRKGEAVTVPCQQQIKLGVCRECKCHRLLINWSATVGGEIKTTGTPCIQCLRCGHRHLLDITWEQWAAMDTPEDVLEPMPNHFPELEIVPGGARMVLDSGSVIECEEVLSFDGDHAPQDSNYYTWPPSISERKPCPFCGGKAHVGGAKQGSEYVFAYCQWCAAETGLHTSREDAAEAWNKRV